jgi:hypothetical protein
VSEGGLLPLKLGKTADVDGSKAEMRLKSSYRRQPVFGEAVKHCPA